MTSNLVVVSSLDGVVRVYDLMRRKMFRELVPDVENQLTCLEVEEEGEIIFAGGFDPYNIYLWSFKTGKLVDVFSGHSAPISHLLYSNQQQSLISTSWDKSIRIIKIFSKDRNAEQININQKIVDIKLSNDEK